MASVKSRLERCCAPGMDRCARTVSEKSAHVVGVGPQQLAPPVDILFGYTSLNLGWDKRGDEVFVSMPEHGFLSNRS